MTTAPHTAGPHVPGTDPEEFARLLRVRRYAVPRAMIGRATERRLAGDWHGACAAAGVDVGIDLYAVRRTLGAETADAVRTDLLHLVPDLLRWHFPRVWHEPAALAPAAVVVLSRPLGDRGPWLFARVRGRGPHESQRIFLELGSEPGPQGAPHESPPWTTSRYLWDSRHVHETRERWGGSADRAPFLDPDGTPRARHLLPTADPGPDADPATRTEWIDGVYLGGRVAEAFAAAGFAFDPADFAEGGPSAAPNPRLSPGRLAAELVRLHAAGHSGRMHIRSKGNRGLLLRGDADRPRIESTTGFPFPPHGAPSAPEALWTRSADIDAVLAGVSPDHLHPVVRDALAPARPPADGPVGPPPWGPAGPVRVRCRGEWHTVTLTGGRLAVPHDDREVAREATLRTLGGVGQGCFTVHEAWATGRGRLPKALRRVRADLFERARNGDTDAVLAYLDAGGDPRLRNGEGETLLHRLLHLDHGVLLPRLLDAGAEVDARDHAGYTPLGRAVASGGDASVLRALVAAGARTGGVAPGTGPRDPGPRDLAELLRWRAELDGRTGRPRPLDPGEVEDLL